MFNSEIQPMKQLKFLLLLRLWFINVSFILCLIHYYNRPIIPHYWNSDHSQPVNFDRTNLRALAVSETALKDAYPIRYSMLRLNESSFAQTMNGKIWIVLKPTYRRVQNREYRYRSEIISNKNNLIINLFNLLINLSGET